MEKIKECFHCRKCVTQCPYGLDTPTLLEKNYEDWMIEDTAKKLLAMLYGEALTKELACNEASGTEGIVATVKAYVNNLVYSFEIWEDDIFFDNIASLKVFDSIL